MARPLRIELAGALYHVTARGNALEDIYSNDAGRQQFLILNLQMVGAQYQRVALEQLSRNGWI